MEIEQIKDLMDHFEASSIYKMEILLGEDKLIMQKQPPAPVIAAPAAPVQAAPAQAQPPAQQADAPAAAPAAGAQPEGVVVKAPVVGVFYDASAPGKEPYVKVGQHVEKGQTLCIIEAMKMMNEITAPVSGTVADILVAREEMVEFEQPIMIIKE